MSEVGGRGGGRKTKTGALESYSLSVESLDGGKACEGNEVGGQKAEGRLRVTLWQVVQQTPFRDLELFVNFHNIWNSRQGNSLLDLRASESARLHNE